MPKQYRKNGGTINNVAAGAESENSKNKTSLSDWREAAISLAAFATSQGGTVHTFMQSSY